MANFKKSLIAGLACAGLCLGALSLSACEFGSSGYNGNYTVTSGDVLGEKGNSKAGYVLEDGSVYYYDESGRKLKSCEFDGRKFDANGKMVSDDFVEIKGATYYVKGGEVAYDYQVIKDKVYNFGEDGNMKQDCDYEGKYFGEDGSLQNDGLIDVQNDTYYVQNAEVSKDYQVIEDKVYNFGDDGKMKKGCEYDGNRFDGEGRMENEDFVDVDEETYYVKDGEIVRDYQVIGDSIYHFNGNGHMKKDEEYDGYFFDKDGKLNGNNSFVEVYFDTYYLEDTEIAYEYEVIENHLYYFGDDGKMWKGGTNKDGFVIGADGFITVDTKTEITIDGRIHWIEGDKVFWYSLGLDYFLNGRGDYSVGGMGDCKDKDVIIPEEYEGLPVTGIGKEAFKGKDIVSVVIPDCVIEIGDKAFENCSALMTIVMPENIGIGRDVFRGSIHVELVVNHNLTYVPAKEATCEKAGNIEHYVCDHCDNYYADKKAKEQIYEVEIPAAHNFVDGRCTKCGRAQDSLLIVSVDEIPYLGKFALGTMENAIGLPETVNAQTADGNTHELSVKWELSDYDKATVGAYEIRGHVQAGALIFADGVSDEVVAQIEIVEYMKGTADIVFVVDITGSMGDEIDNVKENIIAFAQKLDEVGVSARFGLVDYRDITCGEPTNISMNGTSPWYINAEEYKSAIGSIIVNGGGDFEETAIDGLMAATTLETRKDVRTFYVLVTDATHKVDNGYGVADMNQTTSILAEKNVCVSVVAPTEHQSDYSVLTDATEGVMANIYDEFMNVLYNELIAKIHADVIA